MSNNIPFFVPFKKNSHFVGRGDDLIRLHAALQGNQAMGTIPTGIIGLGGIGKTQLAVRYAYDYAAHYPDGVYWLTAVQELDKVFADFGQQLWQIMPYRHAVMDIRNLAILARLVHTLFNEEELNTLCYDLGVEYEDVPGKGLSRAQYLIALLQRQERLTDLTTKIERQRPKLVNRPQDELIRLAFAYLRDSPRSLLILDNLPDPTVLREPVRRDWIPTELPCHLLLTTRRRNVANCHAIELTVLPEPVALQLLLRHPRRRTALDPNHKDHQTARQICALLGYLPLALEVAGAHLGLQERAPMSQYFAELRERGTFGVLDDKRLLVTPTVHETGVMAILDNQFLSLPREEARILLRVAGFFPEAAFIPTARLGLLAGVPEEGASFFDVTLEQALGDLENASLIEEMETGQIRLHPLVREYAARMIVRTASDKKYHARFFVEKLAQAYAHFPILERQCTQRGIDAVQEDLLVALELIAPDLEARVEPLGIPPWRKVPPLPVQPWEEPTYDLPQRLQMLLRLVQREAHNLRAWQPQAQPQRFKKQMLYRAFDLRNDKMLQQIQKELQAGSDYFAPLWNRKMESSALEQTLEGHAGWVSTVAVTPDGQRAISASADRTLKVWNLVTGTEERTLEGHTDRVNAIALTPDGQRAISASNDGTLKVWRIGDLDLTRGEEELTLVGHSDLVLAVAVTPDGRQAISGSIDGALKVWDLATGSEERTLVGHTSEVSAVAVTPDGRRAISASSSGALKVWGLATGAIERTLVGHTSGVHAIVVTPDGQRAISSSGDGTLKVWDLATGSEERALVGHTSEVSAVAVTPDGRRVISASSNGALKVWDLATGSEEQTLGRHSDIVSAVAVTPDGRRAISASDDGTLKVWRIGDSDLAAGAVELALVGHTSYVSAVAVTPDGRRAISVSTNRELKVWNLAAGAIELALVGRTSYVSAVAVTPDGRRAISASWDRMLKVWDLATGAVERTLEGHSDWVLAVAVTPDGRQAISGSIDGALKVWDLATGSEEWTLGGHTDGVRAVAVTPDGQRAISASFDGALKVWRIGDLDLTTGEEERTIEGHANWVNAVAVTPDGRRAISASDDGTLKVWDILAPLNTGLTMGKPERILIGHTSGVSAVAVTPDGRRAISASYDETLKAWDLATGKELATISLDGPLSCLAIAGDGVTIITGDTSGDVYCLRYVAGETGMNEELLGCT